MLSFAAARVIETMQFNWGFARVLLKLTREFRRPPDWWPGRHHRTLDVLKQVVEGEDREEWAGLEALLHEADALNLTGTHLCILHLWRARNLYRQDKPKEALQVCLDAEQVLPDDRSLAEALAEWFDRVGWKLGWERGTAIPSSDAETALCKAVALQDDAGYHWVGLGVMKYGLKKLEDAVEALEKGIQLEGEKAHSLTWLGNVYGTLGRHQEAIAEFQRAIELDPQKGAPYNGLGNVYANLGRHQEAVAEYQKAIELDPQVAIPHNNLGNVYCNLGRHEEAMPKYRQAIELDPQYAYPHNGLGDVYYILGRHNEAVAEYQRAIELDPKYAAPRNGLGNVCRALGRYEEALAEYQRAIELDPEYAAPHHGLGNVYYTLGRHDEAITEYQQAIELDPEHAASHNNLADVYMELWRLEEAQREFEERVRLRPDDALNARVSLGIIAYHQDEQAEAQQQFEQALYLWDTAWTRRLQTPATLLVDKAIALLGLGQIQEALDAVQEGLRRLMPGDRLEEYINHLELLSAAPEPPEGLDKMLVLLQKATE